MRIIGLASMLACALIGLAGRSGQGEDGLVPSDTTLAPFRDSIPGTLVEFEMIPVPAGSVTVRSESGDTTIALASFWIGKTEVTWNEYDVFAYRLDLPQERRALAEDAASRPSRPYAPPDYGYGHDGYAAICVTYRAALEYAKWLSAKTGKSYRLPTEAEWQLAAQAGLAPDAALDAGSLGGIAWFADNAGEKTMAVASLAPNALGAYDLLGNVAEWVVGLDGKPITAGGSFRDPADQVQVSARARQARSWNQTDPQIPKSRWWLSDGFFVGFRLVREP
jgi:formylglycine-generating enzyme required for sulfatase activity